MTWQLPSLEHFNIGLDFNPLDNMITVSTTLCCAHVLRVHLCVLHKYAHKNCFMFYKRHNQIIVIIETKCQSNGFLDVTPCSVEGYQSNYRTLCVRQSHISRAAEYFLRNRSWFIYFITWSSEYNCGQGYSS